MTTLLERLRRPSISNVPPARADIRRNDLATVVWFVFILILGYGIRNNALDAGTTVTLGDNLLEITLPAGGWVQAQPITAASISQTGGEPGTETQAAPTTAATEHSLSVWNSRSASLFDAVISVDARRLRPGENLATTRAALGIQRSRDLPRYRELLAEPVTVLNLVPGTLITYAYIADPTRAAGALAPPVVVQGQDLLFLYRDHLVRVSVAADSAHWNDETRAFDVVFASLHLREAQP